MLFLFQTIILPDNDTSLCDMDIFNGHLVLFLNKKGLPLLCSLNLPFQIDFEVYYLTSITMKLMLPDIHFLNLIYM